MKRLVIVFCSILAVLLLSGCGRAIGYLDSTLEDNRRTYPAAEQLPPLAVDPQLHKTP